MAARKKSVEGDPAAPLELKRTRGRDRRPDSDPRPELAQLGLMQFIPAISPRLTSPFHLAPFVNALDGVVSGTIRDGRFVVTIPMRHGKTFTCNHFVAWALARNPRLEIMSISYAASFVQAQSRRSRRLALEAGVALSADHNTIADWRTDLDGGCHATGIDGDIAGRGADVIIIDDPIKSRLIAESADERQKAADFVEEAISRLNVGGSVFLVSARWHVDDPSGQMLRTGEYQHIHARAIEDEGLPTERALWPEMRPLEALKRTRWGASMRSGGSGGVGEYNWYSWYQGEPRPPDSSLFRGAPMTYRSASAVMQLAIGLDLGFTERGDASAGIVVGRDTEGVVYILRVESWHRTAPAVAEGIAQLKAMYPSAPMFMYYSGAEKGTLDLMTEFPYRLDIIGVPARYNKYARAMATADAWNAGRIRVPAYAPWTEALLIETLNFTGGDGETDDRVDALVAAFDAVDQGGSMAIEPGFHGRRCM